MNTKKFFSDLFLQKNHKNAFILGGLGLIGVLLVGSIDHVTGYEFSFSIFYLVPIIFSVSYVGYRFGILICILSAVTWLIADITSGHGYSMTLIPVWNSFMRCTIFIFIAVLLKKLSDEITKEKNLSRIDPVTQIGNSRYFYEFLERETTKIKRYQRAFAVAYFDIDDFKKVNDILGHSSGDRLLYLVGKTVTETLRTSDVVGRLGGDEFGVIFIETPPVQARKAAERLQEELLSAAHKNNYMVTFSIGVLMCTEEAGSPDELIKMADALMYEAKKAGKNCIRYDICKKSGIARVSP